MRVSEIRVKRTRVNQGNCVVSWEKFQSLGLTAEPCRKPNTKAEVFSEAN